MSKPAIVLCAVLFASATIAESNDAIWWGSPNIVKLKKKYDPLISELKQTINDTQAQAQAASEALTDRWTEVEMDDTNIIAKLTRTITLEIRKLTNKTEGVNISEYIKWLDDLSNATQRDAKDERACVYNGLEPIQNVINRINNISNDALPKLIDFRKRVQNYKDIVILIPGALITESATFCAKVAARWAQQTSAWVTVNLSIEINKLETLSDNLQPSLDACKGNSIFVKLFNKLTAVVYGTEEYIE